MDTSPRTGAHRPQAALVLFAMLFGAARAACAPQGELDATFGENGRMLIEIANSKFGLSISRQPADGKLLFPGYYGGDIDTQDFAVLRLNSDGSPDTSFGVHGIAIVDFGNFDAAATRLAIQPDGRIIVAGSASVRAGLIDFALARLNRDGAIDSTFGDGGLVTLDLGGANDSISDIMLLQSGQIVVVGTTDANGEQDGTFLRLGSNGALDPTFGAGPVAGMTTIGVEDRTDELFSLIGQPDGKFVACGAASDYSDLVYQGDMLAIRINADGSADTTFGTGGVSRTAAGQSFSNAQGCAAMPDGKIVLAGFSGEPGDVKPTLVRLSPDGVPDTTFGNGGISRITVGHSAWMQAIIRLDDQTLGVTGFTSPLAGTDLPTDLFLARIDADSGLLNPNFGDQGVTIVDFGTLSRAPRIESSDLAALADGKLVAVGNSSSASLSLARLDLSNTGNAGFAGLVSTAAGAAEGRDLVIMVRRTGGGTGQLSVDYSTIAASATAPGDMTAVSGTLTWQDGDTAPKSIIVPIIDDGIAEGMERFSVELSGSSSGLAASQFVVDIAANDNDRGSGGGDGTGSHTEGGGGTVGAGGLIALALIWVLAMRQRRREFRRTEIS